MFVSFFYLLRQSGIPVSPIAFLTLHRAMAGGLVNSLDDLYVAARTILVKSERHFDGYDRVFAHLFIGADVSEADETADEAWAHAMLDEWLRDPRAAAALLGVQESALRARSMDELLNYFRQQLRDQDGRHDGGSKWIGTVGTSPVGHSGHHPGGLRVGGVSGHRTAIQVAAERRYRDYSQDRPLGSAEIGAALKKLRHMVPRGARDRLNVEASIRQTMKNGGEIEIVFDRTIVDRMKVMLLIDNGGWSMEPHVDLVQVLFNYARSQFKELNIYYFHNTVYDLLWQDPERRHKPVPLEQCAGNDPQTRLIIVGDASMAPYELLVSDGSIYAFQKSGKPSVERLRYLTRLFRRHAWLNPVPQRNWPNTRTIDMIGEIFPMFELSLDGLERAVTHLVSR